MTLALGAAYEGRRHSTPNTSHLVWRVADKVKELELDKHQPGRSGNDKQKPTVNLIEAGEKKLISSSLMTFNKRLACMIAGNMAEAAAMAEADELPAVAFTLDVDET